jgi:hypothetical protein
VRELLKIVELKDKRALTEVRGVPGLLGALRDDEIWVRGIFFTSDEEPVTARIPSINNFIIGDDDQLFPVSGITPVAKLEKLNWKPLKDLLPVNFPVAAYSGRLRDKFRIGLKVSEQERDIYATEISWNEWKMLADTVSEIRLRRTKFAVTEDKRVIILNSQFISAPGKHFWRNGNILLPLGFDFDPPSLAAIISKKAGEEHDSVLFFNKEGHCERISLSSFAYTSRLVINSLHRKIS